MWVVKRWPKGTYLYPRWSSFDTPAEAEISRAEAARNYPAGSDRKSKPRVTFREDRWAVVWEAGNPEFGEVCP